MPTTRVHKRSSSREPYCFFIVLLFGALCESEIDIEVKAFCPATESFCFFYLSKPDREVRCVKTAQYLCGAVLKGSRLGDMRVRTLSLKKFLSLQLPDHKLVLNAQIAEDFEKFDEFDNVANSSPETMGNYSKIVFQKAKNQRLFPREAKRNKESLDDYLYDEIDTGTQKKADVIDKNIHRWKWVIGEKLVTGRIYRHEIKRSFMCEDPLLMLDIKTQRIMEHQCPNKEETKFSLLCLTDCEFEWETNEDSKLESYNSFKVLTTNSRGSCRKYCLKTYNCFQYQFLDRIGKTNKNCLLAAKNITRKFSSGKTVYSLKPHRENYCVRHKLKKGPIVNLPSCATFINYWFIVAMVVFLWLASFCFIFAFIKYKKAALSIEPSDFNDYYE